MPASCKLLGGVRADRESRFRSVSEVTDALRLLKTKHPICRHFSNVPMGFERTPFCMASGRAVRPVSRPKPPRQSSPVDQALTEVHQAGAEEGASTSANCRCERIEKEVGEYTVPAIECALSEPLEAA